MFYEAKLITGEGSYEKNKDLTDGIGHLIMEQSISILQKARHAHVHYLNAW